MDHNQYWSPAAIFDAERRTVHEVCGMLMRKKQHFNLARQVVFALAGLAQEKLPSGGLHFQCRFVEVPDLAKTFRRHEQSELPCKYNIS